MSEIREWFAGRLPAGWFDGSPDITVDREEIRVLGRLAGLAPEAGAAEAEGRIQRWREETRGQRMRIADEAERRFGRKVAWGARAGDTSWVFTNLAVPVMTRLRQPERMVLDTLVDSGVARSRSEALAWCVQLVGRNESEWIGRLREALDVVAEARAGGPASG